LSSELPLNSVSLSTAQTNDISASRVPQNRIKARGLSEGTKVQYVTVVILEDRDSRLRVSISAFKKPDFRGRQREIMEAAVRGADVLVVAPTGMGKRYATT
jgi:superfamily II DNA helicase RecQ